MGITSLRGGVLDRQLALPSKIAERLAQAISLEGDELLQTTMEIGGLFKKYADYHSLHSGSAVGMAIRKTRTQRSQRAALGGLACSIGILRAWQSNNSRCTTCHPTDTHTASLAAIYVPPSSFFSANNTSLPVKLFIFSFCSWLTLDMNETLSSNLFSARFA